jgi:hypothetical protein
MNHDLRVALCHSITARAHLAGDEAAELEAQHLEYVTGATSDAPACLDRAAIMRSAAAAAHRRYWREVSAAQLLMGHRWPEAEALGVEPPAPVSISQED